MALKYPELFQPFHIGKLEIKNKIVMSGMHNIGWTDAYDLIDDCVIDYFERAPRAASVSSSPARTSRTSSMTTVSS